MEARKAPAFSCSRARATSSQVPFGAAEGMARTARGTSRSAPTGTATASAPLGTPYAVVKLIGTGVFSLRIMGELWPSSVGNVPYLTPVREPAGCPLRPVYISNPRAWAAFRVGPAQYFT